MSSIQFHTKGAAATVWGAERHRFGALCGNLAWAILGHAPEALRRVMPDRWLRDTTTRPEILARLALDDETNRWTLDGQPTGWTISLNTALALGGDAVKLAARLHGQCEIHAYVEGRNRDWLATIIEEGLVSELYDTRAGWQDVQSLLRAACDTPVVTSYSVTHSFPNSEVAGWDYEAWGALSAARQWETALAGLRGMTRYGLELTPERWAYPDYHFAPLSNAMTVRMLLRTQEGE